MHFLCLFACKKLLNFFLKSVDYLQEKEEKEEQENKCATVVYTLESARFVLEMPSSFAYWVKLADYGTAVSTLESLDQPVTLDQVSVFLVGLIDVKSWVNSHI